MKKSPFILFALATSLLVTACGNKGGATSINSSMESALSNPSSSLSSQSSSIVRPDPIYKNSLREGLIYINEEVDFTVDVYLNNTYGFSIYSTETFYGVDNERDYTVFDFYVDDGEGIFSINVDSSRIVSSEYYRDEKGEAYSNLFDNQVAKTFYSIFDNVIGDISELQESYLIKDKATRLSIMDAIGIDRATYVYLDKVEAKYLHNELNMDVIFNDGNANYTYTLKFKNFAATYNERYEKFVRNGGKVYTPNADLSRMRDLFNTDNFIRVTYDIDIEGFNGLLECFHPNYWYQRGSDTVGEKFGYISLNKRASGTDPEDPNYNPDLKGIYMFSTNSGKVSISPNVLWENTDVTKYMHYPKYMKLLSSLQFAQEGTVSEFENMYTKGTTRYLVKNKKIIEDFAKNNSLDRAYDLKKCVPFGLGIELSYLKADKDCTITFHYCFSYQGEKIDYIIPFTNFGQAGLEWLDTIFEKYND